MSVCISKTKAIYLHLPASCHSPEQIRINIESAVFVHHGSLRAHCFTMRTSIHLVVVGMDIDVATM